jgi:hypothetical protein
LAEALQGGWGKLGFSITDFCFVDQNLAGFGKGKKAKVLWPYGDVGSLEFFGCYGWKEIEEFLKPTRG